MLMERNLILNDYYVSIAVALDNIMDFCPSSLQSKWLHQLTSHFTFADDNDLYYNTADLEYLASEVVDRKRWAQEDVRPQFEGFGLQVDTKASDLRNIWWMDVFAPGPVLSRLKKAGVLPFNFRKTFAIKGYDESSLGEFAAQYLAAEYALKDWRELARWIFRDAQPLEISLAQANEVWTPLAIGLMTAHRKSRERLREWLPEQDWDTKKNGKDRQWVEDWMAEEIIRLKGRVRQWVEDLDLAGVDLMEYGKLESAQLTKTNGKPIQTLLSDRFRRLEPESTWENLPYRLTYGPSPEDWDVIFMSEVFFEYEAEGWLEDFWKLVDPVESIMPGTWVDEIEYREEY